MTSQAGNDDPTRMMRTIHAALSRALAADPDVAIALLQAHQMYISKHLQPGPRDGKAPRQVPAEDGYTVHVRLGSGATATRPMQRSSQLADLIVADPDAAPLTLDRTGLDQTWQLRGTAGMVVVVTARCGAAQAFDDVDRVLDILGHALREAGALSGN